LRQDDAFALKTDDLIGDDTLAGPKVIVHSGIAAYKEYMGL
jgi:hypothetical protein